jgi:plasmid stability protein
MAAIVIDGLSPKALAAFERRAAAKSRTVAEEVKQVLEESVETDSDRLPMFVPSQEISAPFDLPYESTGVAVQTVSGGKLWPDRPVSDEDIR